MAVALSEPVDVVLDTSNMTIPHLGQNVHGGQIETLVRPLLHCEPSALVETLEGLGQSPEASRCRIKMLFEECG